MKLADLIAHIGEHRTEGSPQVEVTGLRYDSRRVEKGHAFFAWKGEKTDGHQFIAEVCDKGASAIVLEDERFFGPRATAALVLVPDARRALAFAAADFFERPDRSLGAVGITGTNGKTTTSFVTKALLGTGRPVGLLGTVRYEIGDRVYPAKRTTPEGLDLFDMLAQMRQAGCRHVVMEVSSHALDQGRLGPLEFQVGVFTNLSQDHLDYHGSMEAYFAAKKKLFTGLDRPKQPGTAVLNADEPRSAELEAGLSPAVRRIRYSAAGAPGADITATDLAYSVEGTRGRLRIGDFETAFATPLVGPYNVANTLAAAGAAWALGMEPEQIAQRLPGIPDVPGRLEKFHSGDGVTVVVDYAHTDDAVRKVLQALRPLTRRRLLVVVGCGGDRDAAKRPLMARAAVETADHAIFTSDNPRNEDPARILDHMEAGVRGAGNYERIQDRREAIAEALANAAAGDVVCVAGKGHETYQEIKGTLYPFDDRTVVQEFLSRRRAA